MEVRAEQSEPAGSDDSDFGDDSFPSDGGEESDASGHETGDQVESDDPNKGWADAMAKILNKKIPSDKASTILVKSKTLQKEKVKEKQERLEKKEQVDKKRQWEMMCRAKTDVVKDREAERTLQRIATRGVVQLFNAVKTHQSNVKEKVKEAGNSERKKSKLMMSVSKRDFIDVLRGKESKGETVQPKKATVKTEKTSEWNILRDDFMMGASMKDWDKDSDDGKATGKPKPKAKKEDSESDSDR